MMRFLYVKALEAGAVSAALPGLRATKVGSPLQPVLVPLVLSPWLQANQVRTAMMRFLYVKALEAGAA